MRATFNDLPRSVRERFVALTSGPVASPEKPTPLLAYERRASKVGRDGILACCAGLPVPALLAVWLADSRPPTSIETIALFAAFNATLAIVSAYFFGRALWRRTAVRDGKYLFPSYLVTVSDDEVELTPTHTLGAPTVLTVIGRGGGGGGGGGTFSVIAGLRFKLDHVATVSAQRFLALRERFGAARDAGDTASLAALDPFWECTSSGRWRVDAPAPDGGPWVTTAPPKWRLAYILAPVVALLASLAVGLGARPPRVADTISPPAGVAPSPTAEHPAVRSARPAIEQAAASPAALAFFDALIRAREGYGSRSVQVAVRLTHVPDEELGASSQTLLTLERPRGVRESPPTIDRYLRDSHTRNTELLHAVQRRLNPLSPTAPGEGVWFEFTDSSAEGAFAIRVTQHLGPIDRLVRVPDSRRCCPVFGMSFEVRISGGPQPIVATVRVPPTSPAEEATLFASSAAHPDPESCVADQTRAAYRRLQEAVLALLVKPQNGA